MNKESAASLIAQVISNLEKLLEPDGFSVSLSRVEKLTSSYDSVQFFKEAEKWGFNIPRDTLISLYEKENQSPEEIAAGLAEFARNQKFRANAETFMDFDGIRSSLFIRLSDTERSRQVLEHVPHKEIDGLSVTAHILVPAEDCFASSIVTGTLLEKYGISEEELFDAALQNSARILPAEIRPLSDVIGGGSLSATGKGIVVTNTRKVNGASAILYPGILEQLSDMVQEDFYIFPSSIHEVIVFPCSAMSSDKAACRILHDANRCAVSEEDWLSDTLYIYSRQAGQIHRVAETE